MTAPLSRVVVINDLSRPMGGASALAVQSALGFARAGLSVTFISGDVPPDAGADGITWRGLGQARLLARGRLRAMFSGWWNADAARMIRAEIAANDTPGTVYHLHGWSQILSPSVFAALRPVRDRLVISAHDFFLACPNGAFADLNTGAPCSRAPLSPSCYAAPCDRRGRVDKGWRLIRALIQRLALAPQRCPPVLAIHGAMRPLLRLGGIPDAAIRVLPNPVVPWSETRIPAEDNREVLFVGRLEATKGADLALAAAQQAGVPIRIVGDGAMAEAWRRHWPDARFEGRRTPAEIAVIAREARILVMPSRYPEPFGLVAMEAMRAGLPVILPPSALLAGDAVELGAGAVVEPRETAAFADLLRRLGRDDDAIRAMSRAAFTETGDLALSPEQWLERLMKVYRERLSTTGQPRAARTRPSMSASAAGI